MGSNLRPSALELSRRYQPCDPYLHEALFKREWWMGWMGTRFPHGLKWFQSIVKSPHSPPKKNSFCSLGKEWISVFCTFHSQNVRSQIWICWAHNDALCFGIVLPTIHSNPHIFGGLLFIEHQKRGPLGTSRWSTTGDALHRCHGCADVCMMNGIRIDYSHVLLEMIPDKWFTWNTRWRWLFLIIVLARPKWSLFMILVDSSP